LKNVFNLNLQTSGPCTDWQFGQWYVSISWAWCSRIPTQLKNKLEKMSFCYVNNY